MTNRKERLTVTVDPNLVEAGNHAVAAGMADSLSGWVNAALAAKVAHDRRLQALGEAVSGYEAQFGEITDDELAARERTDRENSVVVRGKRTRPKNPRRSPRRGVA